MVCVRHIGSNYTARDFSLMRVAPRDAPRTAVGAGVDQALAGEVIEIELESILKAGSGSRTRHRYLIQPLSRLTVAEIFWMMLRS